MVYEIAGLRVQIDNKYEFTTKFCQDYLSQDQTSPVDIIAVATDEEFEQEKKIAEQNFSDGYIENICLYRTICRQLPKLNRMLLHAAIIALDGNSYAFLGRSGTGKSTHTGLWIKYLDGTQAKGKAHWPLETV